MISRNLRENKYFNSIPILYSGIKIKNLSRISEKNGIHQIFSFRFQENLCRKLFIEIFIQKKLKFISLITFLVLKLLKENHIFIKFQNVLRPQTIKRSTETLTTEKWKTGKSWVTCRI